MPHNTNLAQTLYTSQMATFAIDEDSIREAKNIFRDYKRKEVILEGSFEEDIWRCSNEYEHINFYFNFDLFRYKRFYEPVLGIDSNNIKYYLKVYILFHMGALQLHTLQNIIRDIIQILQTPPGEIYALNDNVKIYQPYYIIDFLNILPTALDEEAFDELSESLDSLTESLYEKDAGSNQRTLASFDTYMLFGEIMDDYWNSNPDLDEKLFYFPLYLWWKVTGIIPQRPREFLLIPRECLTKKKDGFYLTIRRDEIKGSNKQKTYKIPGDYSTNEYKITDELGESIREYIELTKKYPKTDLDTLFITGTHYKKWKTTNKRSRFYTYTNMCTVLRYFYEEVIFERYGLHLQPDIEVTYLEKDEIQLIHLGDTRHLALINIIAEGGTPVTAMMLAGHQNMITASHYYSNLTTLVECRTYRQYRKVLNGTVNYQLSTKEALPPTTKSFIRLPNGGKCYSVNTLNMDFCDCKKVVGENGEIGYCPDCRWYRKASSESYLSDDSGYKRKISEDCEYLEKVVRSVRMMKGDAEDIMQAFLRLKSSAYEYEQYLKEKKEEEYDKRLEEMEEIIWLDQ